MAEQQSMEAAPLIGKPGIAVRGFPPNTDDEFLGLYFSRFGSDIKHIEIFEDNKVAYIEFSDPAGTKHLSPCRQGGLMHECRFHAVVCGAQWCSGLTGPGLWAI